MTTESGLMIEDIQHRVGELSYQVRLTYTGEASAKGGVLLAPPHPFLGGNFENNILAHLTETLATAGYAVMTYNLPGVGKSSPRPDSEGSRERFWSDSSQGPESELDRVDFVALAEYLAHIAGSHPSKIFIGGYSYGAAIALLAGRNREYAGLLLISPPLSQLPIDLVLKSKRPLLLICAEHELASDDRVLSDLAQHPSMKNMTIIRGSDHFYFDHLPEVCSLAREFLESIEPAAISINA